jgi:hypothetical protein
MTQDLSVMEWLRTWNNPFEEDMLQEVAVVVVDGIWLKSDACKTDELGKELNMQFFLSLLNLRGFKIITTIWITQT